MRKTREMLGLDPSPGRVGHCDAPRAQDGQDGLPLRRSEALGPVRHRRPGSGGGKHEISEVGGELGVSGGSRDNQRRASSRQWRVCAEAGTAMVGY